MFSHVALGLADFCMFGGTLAISFVIGIYFANKNASMEDYTLGGRNQKLLPVAVSLMTSFTSGIALIGDAAEFYYDGIPFTLLSIGIILSVPFSTLVLMPVFYRLDSVSVFTYIELRFSSVLKRLISIMFMLQMSLYNAAVLLVPSISLQSVFGISSNVSIGLAGCSCILYSTFGGIKAVIWTDFFQAGLMYLSLLCIAVYGTYDAGGIDRIINDARESGRFSLDHFLDFDLTTRHTLYTIAIGGTLVQVFMNGANQIQVQRSFTLPSLRLAQWSQVISACLALAIITLASYPGLILYSKYKTCDPFKNGEIAKKDAILLYYINTQLADLPGLRGLFIAGIFAGTLSTLSSFQNAMSALMLTDIIKPLMGDAKPMKAQTESTISKLIAFLFGSLCVTMAFMLGKVSGLLQLGYTLFGAIGGPLISAFVLGMTTRFVNAIGMISGLVSGLAFGIFIQISHLIQHSTPPEPSMCTTVIGCHLPMNSTSSLLEYVCKSSAHQPSSHLELDLYSKIVGMSYFWVPVFTFSISSLIACLVSLLTGGRNQKIDSKYLVSWMSNKETYDLRS